MTSLMVAVTSQKAAARGLGSRLVFGNMLVGFSKKHFKRRPSFYIFLAAQPFEKSSCVCGFLGVSREGVLVTAGNGSSDP